MSFIGATVEKQIIFRDTNGNLADPAVVNANAKDPLGNSRVGTVIKESLGVFDALFVGDVVGLWFWRIEGEGGGVDAVEEGSFCVRESSVE